jgi:YD repeat-containing protein
MVYGNHGRAVVSADQYLDPTGTAFSSGPVYGKRTPHDGRGRQVGSQRLEGAVIVLDSVTGRTTLSQAGTVLHESQSVYDAKGHLPESFGPTGVSTRYEYDSFGRQSATLGPASVTYWKWPSSK